MSKSKGEGKSGVRDFSGEFSGSEQIPAQTGEWFEFTEICDRLIGKYLGMEPFRNGHKATIQTEDGPVVFSAATLLHQQLQQVNVGDRLAIVLAGFQPSDKGNPLKIYQVFRPKQSKTGSK